MCFRFCLSDPNASITSDSYTFSQFSEENYFSLCSLLDHQICATKNNFLSLLIFWHIFFTFLFNTFSKWIFCKEVELKHNNKRSRVFLYKCLPVFSASNWPLKFCRINKLLRIYLIIHFGAFSVKGWKMKETFKHWLASEGIDERKLKDL